MEQKIILITGASSGLGKAIFEHLTAQGHTVYGTSRKPSDDSRFIQCDVTDYEQCRKAVQRVVEREKRIDVLINNAGMGLGGAIELTTDEEFALQMNTNFLGTHHLCRATLPYMRAQRKGLIINMSSIAGRFAIPFQGAYSVSKFAIEGYSQALTLETRKFGIKTVVINPGDFTTNFTSSRKISSETTTCPDYAPTFERVLKNIEKDENNGTKPPYLAKKIARIVNCRCPKAHYVVTADPVQHLAVWLSMILPQNLFLRLIRLFYNA